MNKVKIVFYGLYVDERTAIDPLEDLEFELDNEEQAEDFAESNELFDLATKFMNMKKYLCFDIMINGKVSYCGLDYYIDEQQEQYEIARKEDIENDFDFFKKLYKKIKY